MLRTFFAIDLPTAFREEIGRIQARLKKAGEDVKWVKPDSVHLTLKFLGPTAEDMLDPLAGAAARAAAGSKSITLSISGTGVFPGPARPKVCWLGLDGEIGELSNLRKALERAVAPLGFEPEKRDFSPHLTLGRFRGQRVKSEFMSELESIKPRPLVFKAGEIVLFKSDLRPAGAIYTPLKTIPLGKTSREGQT